MSTVLVLHSPHLKLLGTGEPSIRGALTLADIEARRRSAIKAVAAPVIEVPLSTVPACELAPRPHPKTP